MLRCVQMYSPGRYVADTDNVVLVEAALDGEVILICIWRAQVRIDRPGKLSQGSRHVVCGSQERICDCWQAYTRAERSRRKRIRQRATRREEKCVGPVVSGSS